MSIEKHQGISFSWQLCAVTVSGLVAEISNVVGSIPPLKYFLAFSTSMNLVLWCLALLGDRQ
ncbi:hypothetical protein [Flavobacterium sp. 9AF]|uniref:hypothetical protein n=1 Tax=Flavobacterium sp. 9AF TaxID=2653142 RepID=UPI00135C6452|nr:hypothetical protein [Flavobacterium sp. 9AF]